jgi:hypothetical protein
MKCAWKTGTHLWNMGMVPELLLRMTNAGWSLKNSAHFGWLAMSASDGRRVVGKV